MTEGSPQAPDEGDVVKAALAAHGGDLGRAIGVLLVDLQHRIAYLERRVEALETKRGAKK